MNVEEGLKRLREENMRLTQLLQCADCNAMQLIFIGEIVEKMAVIVGIKVPNVIREGKS